MSPQFLDALLSGRHFIAEGIGGPFDELDEVKHQGRLDLILIQRLCLYTPAAAG